MNDLEKTINEEVTTVTKEYIKDRKNVYSRLAVANYERTTDNANKMVSTLIRIITTLRNRNDKDVEDLLLNILSRRN